MATVNEAMATMLAPSLNSGSGEAEQTLLAIARILADIAEETMGSSCSRRVNATRRVGAQ